MESWGLPSTVHKSLWHLTAWRIACCCVYKYKKETFMKRTTPFAKVWSQVCTFGLTAKEYFIFDMTRVHCYLFIYLFISFFLSKHELFHFARFINLLSWKIFLTLGPPFAFEHIYISKNLIAFLDVHTRENEDLSIMYTMYTNASNNTPFYIHIDLHIIWRIHHLGEFAR
jgi:hypothetical protein